MDFFTKIANSYVLQNNEVNAIDPNQQQLSPEQFDHLNDTICLGQSLRFCLFWPIFYIPYFLRAIRLLKVFQEHKKYVMKKRKQGVVAF